MHTETYVQSDTYCTHIDMPVQTYIYRLIHWHTYLALKIHFALEPILDKNNKDCTGITLQTDFLWPQRTLMLITRITESTLYNIVLWLLWYVLHSNSYAELLHSKELIGERQQEMSCFNNIAGNVCCTARPCMPRLFFSGEKMEKTITKSPHP
jgi:hypothetical protein